jgi:glycine cleavage system H protein
MSSKVPADLRYAKSHEWVRVEGAVATVGITDHAQQELTDIVFVELPALGRVVQAGQPCAVVESVKTASDIYAPLSGEVIAVNEALSKTPALVNDQPYGEGWFYRVRMSNPAEVEGLLTPAAYTALIGA